jgi:NADPH2:quinone reductase
VIVGNRGSLQFTPRQAMTKDATLYGMSLFNSTQKDRDEIHSAIYNGLSAGFLKPVVREAIPLLEAPRAHVEINDSKAFGKIVLTP